MSKVRKARHGVALAAAVAVVGGLLSIGGPASPAAALVNPGTTELISQKTPGADDAPQGPYRSYQAAISANARYVVFTTLSPLDPVDAQNDYYSGEDNADEDVYVKDRVTGALTLLSRDYIPFEDNPVTYPPTPGQPNPSDRAAVGSSSHPTISADGRYVAFQTTNPSFRGAPSNSYYSAANHYYIVEVDRDPDGDGVFDEPRGASTTPDLLYHQVSPRGTTGGEFPQDTDESTDPSISADGGAVAYTDDDLLADGRLDATTVLVTYLSAPEIPDPDGPGPAGSGTGGADVSAAPPPFDGQIDDNTYPVRPIPPAGGPNSGVFVAGGTEPALSADGEQVAWAQQYAVGEGEGGYRYVSTVQRLEVRSEDDAVRLDGPQVIEDDSLTDVQGDQPAIDRDGSKVVYHRYHADEAAPVNETVLVDGRTGDGEVIVSLDNAGKRAEAVQPTISADGRYVAFATDQENMHNGLDHEQDDGAWCDFGDAGFGEYVHTGCDIVVRDVVADAARVAAGLPRLPGELATPSLNMFCAEADPAQETCEGEGRSEAPSLSGDGGTVAYGSEDPDLVRPDSNTTIEDVFAREFHATVAGDPVNFGTVDVGQSAIASVVLHGVGFGPAYVLGIAITGADAGDFQVFPAETCTGAIVHAPDDTCVVSIRYTPSAGGTRNAQVTATVRGRPDNTLVNVPITGGAGRPTDQITVGPNPVDFGEHLALTLTGPKIVTFTNTGRKPVKINDITLVNAPKTFPGDYAVGGDNCSGRTLANGAKCTIGVNNMPHGSGSRPGVILIDDDSSSGPHLVSLTAAGITPTARLNPGVVVSGRVTAVRGEGWPKNQPVTVTFEGFTQTYTAKANDAGEVTIPVLIFKTSDVGTRLATATVAGTTLKVTAPLLVTLGTYQSPDFPARR